jgi:hypothetical protein
MKMGAYEVIAVKRGWVIREVIGREGVFAMAELIVFTDFEKLCDWIKENIKPLD